MQFDPSKDIEESPSFPQKHKDKKGNSSGSDQKKSPSSSRKKAASPPKKKVNSRPRARYSFLQFLRFVNETFLKRNRSPGGRFIPSSPNSSKKKEAKRKRVSESESSSDSSSDGSFPFKIQF